jgi:phospholipase/carboxylesterase
MHRKVKDQKSNPRMGLALLCAALCTWAACNNLTLLHHPNSEQNTKAPDLTLPYKTVLTDRSNNDARLPLIIAMHGLGGTPDDMIRTLSDLEVPARVFAPYGLFPFGMQGGASWYANAIPSRTSDPQLIAEDMNYAADKLAQFISKAMKHYPEAGTPIVTGYSQGGMLTYALSVRYPHLVSSAIPVAGFIPATILPEQSIASGPYPKVEALHGYNDKIVPFDADLDGIEALNFLGQKAVLYRFNDTGHFMTQRMFNAYLIVVDRAVATQSPESEWD